jgi:putative two-component system response regulator
MHYSTINKNILFVDDDTNIHKGLNRLFQQQKVNWTYRFAAGVDEAIAIIDEGEVDAVISDIKMPARDGFDLLVHLRHTARWQDLPIVMLTGLDNPVLKSKALDLGATDLLNKPINPDDLLARIRSVLYIKECQDRIKLQNCHLENLVRQRTEALAATRLDMIWRLGKAAEFRSEETGNHVVRVGYYSRVLAEQLGLAREEQEMIFLTSPLHDLGKIGIPDRVLLKSGKLNSEEWGIMKTHCTIGQELLARGTVLETSVYPAGEKQVEQVLGVEDNPFLQMASEIAGFHHQQWRGKGYPYAVQGEDIPLPARVVTVADVYDALRTQRSYKVALAHEETLVIMRRENGRHFDPAIFSAFEQCLPQFIEIHHRYNDI